MAAVAANDLESANIPKGLLEVVLLFAPPHPVLLFGVLKRGPVSANGCVVGLLEVVGLASANIPSLNPNFDPLLLRGTIFPRIFR